MNPFYSIKRCLRMIMTEKLPKENQNQKKCLFIIYLLALGMFIAIFTTYNSERIDDVTPDVIFRSKPGQYSTSNNPIHKEVSSIADGKTSGVKNTKNPRLLVRTKSEKVIRVPPRFSFKNSKKTG